MRQLRPPRMRPPLRRWRERGVAVITALLLTTLAISIVASLFWQQQVEVRSMENQRLHLQTRWILRGALDWATLVLFQDAMDNPMHTSLDQVWATPLAETRLDQYIERERVEGEHFDATLSGNITDACSRYNLRNLAVEFRNVNGDQVEVFKRLLSNLQMDPSLAQRAANLVAVSLPAQAVPDNVSNNTGGAAATGGTGGTGNASGTGATGSTSGGGTGASSSSRLVPASAADGMPMKLLQVDDLLAVPGFTPAMIDRLRPYVTVLPAESKVNVNTASPEVLAALLGDSAKANTLAVERKQAPFRDMAYFITQANPDSPAKINAMADVKSDWFLVDSRIRLDRAALDAEALVYRPLSLVAGAGGGPVVKWVRQY